MKKDLKHLKLDLPATVYAEEIIRAFADDVNEDNFIQTIVELLEARDEDDVLVTAILTLLLSFVKKPTFDSTEFFRLSSSLNAMVGWCKKMEGPDVYATPNEEQQSYILDSVGGFLFELEQAEQEAADHRKLIAQKKKQGLIN